MKKYYIADLLTLARFICGAVLFGFVMYPGLIAPADWLRWAFLIVFVIGELTDAFDGIAARRWPYPDDGKERWWRIYAVQLDQWADIFLLANISLYVICLEPLTVLLVIIATACAIPIQIWRNHRIQQFGPDESKDPLRVKVVLARRFGYLGLIAYAIIQMIMALPTDNTMHFALIALGVTTGIALAIVKRNRLTEDKTT